MQNPGEIVSNYDKIVDSFEDLNLKEDLLRGIFAYGFEKPSAIQKRAILPAIEGHDVIAQAQSGTGKTGTFCISVLQNIDTSIKQTQAIILAPTRELAIQIHKVIVALGDYMGAKCCACIGGRNVREDIRNLESGMHVVVGTPGRVKDMLSKGHIKSQYVRMFVLDEADEMLSRGFQESVCDCVQNLNKETQMFILSATMPDDVLEVTNRFMNNPVKILVKKEELTLEGIRQFYVNVGLEEYKFETITDLYESLTIAQAVIFCNSRNKVTFLTDNLREKDFVVSSVHGEMDQTTRDQIMNEFRSGSSRVLITTDLLCRGIDVQQVSLVINYDLPMNKENYIHRIGRGGRFGRKGVAINFVTDKDVEDMQELEKFYNTRIEEMPTNLMEYL